MIKIGDKVEILDNSDNANMIVPEFGPTCLMFRVGAIVTVCGLEDGYIKIRVGLDEFGIERTNIIALDKVKIVS